MTVSNTGIGWMPHPRTDENVERRRRRVELRPGNSPPDV
jgi:hypothetical protein